MATAINTHHFHKSVIRPVLLFIAFTHPLVTHAQSTPAKFKNVEDSMVIVNSHLSKWHPYGGVHVSSDAEMYYGGPSFQTGVDYNLARHLALSTYVHYFHASSDLRDNTGAVEKGQFKTFTSALLFQVNLGAGWYKGVFVACGLALQQYSDKYKGNFLGGFDEVRTTVTPAIRMGYIFPAGLRAIAVEFNGTGPYSYSDGGNGTITEVFTMVSLGVRFIF